MKYINILFLCLAFLCLYCTDNNNQENIIASVAEKNIYLDDYLDRAELTVRPAFLKDKGVNEKKLVLNALIAEKILAIEAEKDTAITGNEKLQHYVKGITEQAMREMHFNRFAIEQVSINQQEIEEIVQNANRQFDLTYFDLPASENYDSLARVLKKDNTIFNDVVQQYYPGRNPQQQTVAWNNVLNTEMYENLYRDPVQPGDIIGPVIRGDDRVFFFRIDGWKNSVTLSESDKNILRTKTEQKIKHLLAAEKYETVIKELMDGKELVFNLDGLIPLVNMLGPIFLDNNGQKTLLKNQLNRFQQEVRLDTLRKSQNPNGHKIVFSVAGNNWTVDDILTEIQHHPLVFRKRRFAKSEFGENLKIALVDLVRDHYITKKAYEMGFDKTPQIINTRKVWKDHFYAVLMREKLLTAKTDTSLNAIEYLDQKIRKMRASYSDDISINNELLNKTEIAEVQLLAYQRNVPYPMVAPGFPLLTLDDN